MIHTTRRIVTNTFLFTGTLVLQKILSFAYFAFLSANLGPERLGIYIWTLSLTSIFSIGIDLGLSPLLIREATRDPLRSERLMRSVLGLKIIFSILTLGILVTYLGLKKPDAITLITVSGAAVVMLADSFTMSFYSVLRARQNVKFESAGMLLFHILVFGLGVYFLGIARSPIMAISALALGGLVNLIYSSSVVHFKLRFRIFPRFEWETAGSLLRLLPAFATAGIFVRIYNSADSILLEELVGPTAVGLYSVPAKVVTALQILIPGAFVASIYPAMSHYYRTSRIMLERIFERSIGYLILIALPITSGLIVLIPLVLETVWPAYRPAQNTFIVMALGLPVLFLTFPSGYLLNACDRQRKNTINRGIITVANIVLNLILIPRLGILGAGIAFLAANTLLFILDFVGARVIVPIERTWLVPTIVKSAIATFVMTVTLLFIRDRLPLALANIFGLRISLVLLIIIGGVTYGLMVLVLRVFGEEERKMLKELIRRPPKIDDVSPEV